MQRKRKAIPPAVQNTLFSLYLFLLILPVAPSANSEYISIQQPLDLSLPNSYTAPPPEGVQHDLNLSRNIYQSSLSHLEPSEKRALPLGLERAKFDKTMKVRGWKVKDGFYIGHTRVGKESGVGMLMTSGNFTYGLNNKGVGMTYKSENSRYRLNMREVSVKIEF